MERGYNYKHPFQEIVSKPSEELLSKEKMVCSCVHVYILSCVFEDRDRNINVKSRITNYEHLFQEIESRKPSEKLLNKEKMVCSRAFIYILSCVLEDGDRNIKVKSRKMN